MLRCFRPSILEQERKALGEHAFKREYLGIPVSGAASPFTLGALCARHRLARAVDAARPRFWATAAAAAGPGAQSVSRSHLARSCTMTAMFSRSAPLASSSPAADRPRCRWQPRSLDRGGRRLLSLCAGNPWHQRIQRVAAGPLWQCARQCAGAG